jgi:hypothetical protein
MYDTHAERHGVLDTFDIHGVLGVLHWGKVVKDLFVRPPRPTQLRPRDLTLGSVASKRLQLPKKKK